MLQDYIQSKKKIKIKKEKSPYWTCVLNFNLLNLTRTLRNSFFSRQWGSMNNEIPRVLCWLDKQLKKSMKNNMRVRNAMIHEYVTVIFTLFVNTVA